MALNIIARSKFGNGSHIPSTRSGSVYGSFQEGDIVFVLSMPNLGSGYQTQIYPISGFTTLATEGVSSGHRLHYYYRVLTGPASVVDIPAHISCYYTDAFVIRGYKILEARQNQTLPVSLDLRGVTVLLPGNGNEIFSELGNKTLLETGWSQHADSLNTPYASFDKEFFTENVYVPNTTQYSTPDGQKTFVILVQAIPPTKPSGMSVPSTAKVGQTVSLSWSSVPVPSQPAGVTLTSNTVYYEVDFFDGTQWRNVTSKTSGTSVNYTIPTMADSNQARFRVRAFVEAYGQRFYTDYGQASGYRESTTLVVYNNNKPTTPQAFSAPVGSDRLRVGFSYNIAWGPASDLDNDPLTYQLDFFNGSTWTTVADGVQGTNRQFVVPTGPDTLQAQFRVRAYDGRDYSEYRYSDRFEVFTNTPPNTPRPFTLPKSDEMRIIDLQTPYRVEWGEADVEEHETPKYEVSFRASYLDNWQVIRDINHPDATKTYIDHILPNVQDSETAQYRVRAYDGYEFGGYTESNYFSITGNKVTNTSGYNEEIFPRMAIGQEMRLSWQPAETARNTDVYYDIEVFNGFEWLIIAHNVPTNSLVFRIPEMEDTPYAKIRIRSKTPFQFGGYVESDWIETPNFTVVNFFVFDDISVPFLNDVQKKENVDYLRQKVNDMRIVNDLPPMVFTDEVIIRYETAIKNVHFDELEQGILECFDKNPRAKFNSARTEQELRKVKEYRDQAELIQDLPQRLDFISKALMNQ